MIDGRNIKIDSSSKCILIFIIDAEIIARELME
jgi:hypothetical protein